MSDAGRTAEQLAAAFLERQGLTLLARNYRCRFGEIDLVMRDGDSVVFVEVRLRRSSAFGGAAFVQPRHPALQVALQQAHLLHMVEQALAQFGG